MRRSLLSIVVAALILGACEQAERSSEQATPEVAASTVDAGSPTPERRGLTRPEEVVVDNLASGRYRRYLETAIADLKAISFWGRLTKELFVVEVSARPGRAFVPEDAHLADAFRTLDIREDHAGVLCDITFYPTAMTDDLDRWRDYYDRGLLPDRPPTVRQLWASILAHELSHCLKRDNDEEAAQEWERRALEALREAGL